MNKTKSYSEWKNENLLNGFSNAYSLMACNCPEEDRKKLMECANGIRKEILKRMNGGV